MLKRILVVTGLLASVSCAAGEEIDISQLHANGTSGSGGDSMTSIPGNSGGSDVGNNGGSVGTGQSGSNVPSSSGGNGGSGTPQGDASTGSAGHGGAGGTGSSGAAGSGGSAVLPVSDAGFVAGFSVLYKATDNHATTHYVNVELHAKNGGSSPINVGELKVRYYFTDEVKKTPKITIEWSHVTTAGANADLAVSSAVSAVVPAAATADTYIEFGFSGGHSSLLPGESADFSWHMNGPNEGTDVYTQSNDYSFDAAKTAVTTWDHVVALRNGIVVWGTPP